MVDRDRRTITAALVLVATVAECVLRLVLAGRDRDDSHQAGFEHRYRVRRTHRRLLRNARSGLATRVQLRCSGQPDPFGSGQGLPAATDRRAASADRRHRGPGSPGQTIVGLNYLCACAGGGSFEDVS